MYTVSRYYSITEFYFKITKDASSNCLIFFHFYKIK